MEPTPSQPRPRAARAPLPERLRAQRAAARARVAAWTRQPLTAEQRDLDVAARRRVSPRTRAILVVVMLAGSVAVHGALVGAGIIAGGLRGKDQAVVDRLDIQVREREPEKPPPPPPVAAAPPRPEKRIEKPIPASEPPPPEPTPVEDRKPPPRVVGISLENTVEGGGGPSFAVGNTRGGETAERAEDPKNIAPLGQAPPAPEPIKNQVASRIPTAGAVYALPKRKDPRKPPYPETLKSQGIEADVTVMIRLDATGKVSSVTIVKKSGYPEFDEAARATAMAEQYEPATRDGLPIPYTLSFTYHFRLEEQG